MQVAFLCYFSKSHLFSCVNYPIHDFMKHLFLLILFLSVHALSSQTDDAQRNLALQYYNNGEYEKAVTLFDELYEKSGHSDYFYRYLLNSYLKLENYKAAEKLSKNQWKRNKGNEIYLVDRGYVAKLSGDLKSAKRYFESAIEEMDPGIVAVSQLATAFIQADEFDLAVKTYKKGRQRVKGYTFDLELARLYYDRGDPIKMSHYLLDYLAWRPGEMDVIKSILQDPLSDDEVYTEVQKQLYRKIRENPTAVYYNELLIWLFLQRRDFENALLQAKALDKRFGENGERVFKLATEAINMQDYDAAIEGLDYLLKKGRNSPYYFYAREAMLTVKKEKLNAGYQYSREEVESLKSDYEDFIKEFGQNPLRLASIKKDLAYLEAYYLHDLKGAISLCEELLKAPGLNRNMKASIKLDYADYLLADGQVWDATLIYAQVDLDLKDEPLGELARYKNAKLYYYIGDFEFSQGMLEVLKGSSSELIANDALELSIFITSNLGLDTTALPLMLFAKADLLKFQKKYTEATALLDSIAKTFPAGELMDDIWYQMANIAMEEQDIDAAISYYEKVIEQDFDDLLKDNALFRLAEIYDRVKGDENKAMELYKELILDYQGSIFTEEARERFRALRGDQL